MRSNFLEVNKLKCHSDDKVLAKIKNIYSCRLQQFHQVDMNTLLYMMSYKVNHSS